MRTKIIQGVAVIVLLLGMIIACTGPTKADDLPPDPGEEGKKTLEGIDSNNNGVRDDVERYILSTYPKDNETINLLFDYAKILQTSITKEMTEADIKALETQSLQKIYCLVAWQPNNQDIIQSLEIAFFNTTGRYDAFVDYTKRIPSDSTLIDNSLLANCSEKIREKSSSLLSPSTAESNEVVFFINGIWNDLFNAKVLGAVLERKINRHVVVLHNDTHGTLFDLIELTAQKYNEPREKVRDWVYGVYPPVGLSAEFYGQLAKAVASDDESEDLSKFEKVYNSYLKKNSKVVIVSHSQGNMFANRLFQLIEQSPDPPKRDGKVCGLDVVAVATPANRTVGSGKYFTAKNDLIITPLPSSLRALHENSLTFQESREDAVHHTFLKTYLTGDKIGPAILSAINGSFEKLTPPIECDTPIAVLASSKISGNAPLSVGFDASKSTDNSAIGSYEFNFGDGTTKISYLSEIEHIYTTPGTYQATVVVTDQGGLVSLPSSPITITVGTATLPVGNLSASPTSGNEDLEVSFDATGSTPTGSISSYEFDFGDGFTESNNTGLITHTYTAPGTYQATVKVTDTDGLESLPSASITIEVLPVEEPLVAVLTVSYDYYSSEREIVGRYEDAKVTFDATVSTPISNISSYEFDFGDGGIETNTSGIVSHVYPKAGTYETKVTVTDKNGQKSESSVPVTIYIGARFVTLAGNTTCLNPTGAALFTSAWVDADDYEAVIYEFDFGDGTTESFLLKDMPNGYIFHSYPVPPRNSSTSYQTIVTAKYTSYGIQRSTPSNSLTVIVWDRCV